MEIKKKSGTFWHVHHDVLLEYSHNISKRIEYIKFNKPEHEIKLRLELLKPVRGKLPIGFREARRSLREAERRSNKAEKLYYNMVGVKLSMRSLTRRTKAVDSIKKALNTCIEAMNTYEEVMNTYKEAITKNYSEITKLHLKECKNCPWNGTSIFSWK